MLNDFGDDDNFSKSGGYQLVVSFDNEEELKKTYLVYGFYTIGEMILLLVYLDGYLFPPIVGCYTASPNLFYSVGGVT